MASDHPRDYMCATCSRLLSQEFLSTRPLMFSLSKRSPKSPRASRRVFLRRATQAVVGGMFTGALIGAKECLLGATAKSRAGNLDGQSASLRSRAEAKGILYGAAVHSVCLKSDNAFAAAYVNECGLVVPETEFKWKALRPAVDRFEFSAADWLVAFAESHRLRFRGHPLVWHASLPSWLTEDSMVGKAESLLREHISTVVERYAGRMHSWDVVNEAILPKDGRPDGLRKTVWLDLIGPDYLAIAYTVAAAADPKALLVYNDYALEYDTREDDQKRDAVLRQLGRLKASKVPVH